MTILAEIAHVRQQAGPDYRVALVTGDYDLARRDAYSHTPTAGFLCRHGEEV